MADPSADLHRTDAPRCTCSIYRTPARINRARRRALRSRVFDASVKRSANDALCEERSMYRVKARTWCLGDHDEAAGGVPAAIGQGGQPSEGSGGVGGGVVTWPCAVDAEAVSTADWPWPVAWLCDCAYSTTLAPASRPFAYQLAVIWAAVC